MAKIIAESKAGKLLSWWTAIIRLTIVINRSVYDSPLSSWLGSFAHSHIHTVGSLFLLRFLSASVHVWWMCLCVCVWEREFTVKMMLCRCSTIHTRIDWIWTDVLGTIRIDYRSSVICVCRSLSGCDRDSL